MSYEEQLKDPRWEAKRQQVFDLYGKVCYKCMQIHNIQVHHKHYITGRMAWEYSVFDLVPLCGDCHALLHDKVPFTKPYKRINTIFAEAIRLLWSKSKGNG